MYPHERSLVRNLDGKPFEIIGVNSDRDLGKIKVTAAEKHITWRSFWNGEKGTGGPISKKWNVTGWPTTYLIDKDGVIRFKNVRGKALDNAIETLMGEMGEKVALADIDHEAEDEKALAEIENAKTEAASVAKEAADADKDEEKTSDETSEKKADTKAEDASSDEKSSEEKSEQKSDDTKTEAAADESKEAKAAATGEKEDADKGAKESEAKEAKADDAKATEKSEAAEASK